ncbi:MAG: hypothetical protein HY906_19855 [Deltaproteobacteria bacterium]|nr:hypothetical protein [Deltaproteobacteria bacterium]
MPIDVTVPPVGESITEGVLAEWLKHDGDVVALDDPLFALETDKITMTVNAIAAGRLTVKVAAREAVTFLKRIVTGIENPGFLLLEV